MTIKIGDSATRSRTVEAEDIELYARMTGDRNPLHFDADLAGRSRFGGIVVQGGVTSGLLNALVAEDLPGPGSVFLHTDWSFRAPVRPGDVITAEARVLQTRADKPITTLETVIRNQDGVIVLDGTAVVDLGVSPGGRRAVLMSADAPRTAELYAARGLQVVTVPVTEFEKLEGCVTCLSVRIRRQS